MDLFTFIFEFRGGTYTSQLKAIDINKALLNWTEKLKKDSNQIDHLGPKTIIEIKDKLFNLDINEKPTMLSDMKNIWCITLNTKKGFGLINIVKTVDL
ncbi:hypothetical protein [uncultured Tenacibaculum sp.]|uniref:hypothetical protein n=1 Tax=uncultured Tenacibaculum sp. TaxID=174713 RepID=UPI0026352921|nr:hypothetical protein [uncultured Tenacibaculum sp.]